MTATKRSRPGASSRPASRSRPAKRAKATAAAPFRGKTMFFAPRNQTLADIITIRSPREARASIGKLERWADGDADRARKALRAATLAANRALVSTRRKQRPISPAEKKEMQQVAQIYRRFSEAMSGKLVRLKTAPRRAPAARARARRSANGRAAHPG